VLGRRPADGAGEAPSMLTAGARLPDVELLDHAGNRRRLSELVAGDPTVPQSYRGWWCREESSRADVSGAAAFGRSAVSALSTTGRGMCSRRAGLVPARNRLASVEPKAPAGRYHPRPARRARTARSQTGRTGG
jgi:hypothetical protein